MAYKQRTLIEIDAELYEMLDAVDPETGEYLHSWEEISEKKMEQHDKQVAAAIYIKSLNEHIKAMKEAKRRHDNAIKSFENRVDYLKQNLMISLDGEKIQEKGVISAYYKSTSSVEIDEGTELPDEFVKIVREPKKTELREAIEEGEIIEGVRLVDKVSLVVR